MDGTESGGVVRAAPSVELLPVKLEGRQVGVLSVDSPGVRDEWEMHPEQDELLYLLEGTIDVLLRADLGKSEEERLQFQERPGLPYSEGNVAPPSGYCSVQDVVFDPRNGASSLCPRIRVDRADQLISDKCFSRRHGGQFDGSSAWVEYRRSDRLSPFRLRLGRRVPWPRVARLIVEGNEVVSGCVSRRASNFRIHRLIGDPCCCPGTIAEAGGGGRWSRSGGLRRQRLPSCGRPCAGVLEPGSGVLEHSHESEGDKEHQWCQPEHHVALKTKVLRRARRVCLEAIKAIESVCQTDEPATCRSYGNEPQQEPQVSHGRPPSYRQTPQGYAYDSSMAHPAGR